MGLRLFNAEKDRTVFVENRLFEFVGDGQFSLVTNFSRFLEAYQNSGLFFVLELGGPGSGHHGHKGVKGRRGGSSPGIKKAASSLITNNKEILSDSYDKDVAKALPALRKDALEYADGEGFGEELRHWTNWFDQWDEYDKYNPMQTQVNDERKPDWVPAGQSPKNFSMSRLNRYYTQDPTRKDTYPITAMKKALAGDYGENHQKAAVFVKSLSEEIFRQKFGDKAELFRAAKKEVGFGSRLLDVSVSETSGGASRAVSRFFKPVITRVRVGKDNVLFSYRIIGSEYPEEREWVVSSADVTAH